MQVELEKAVSSKELLYTTVFSQCFSPCGKYLVACCSFGKISIFSLAAALSAEASTDSWKAWLTFQAHDGGAIYSLISTDTHLISAGTGSICAWKWSQILSKVPKVAWFLNIPSPDRTANPETNSLAVDDQDGRLFAGCGDNLVHVWDMSSGSHLLSLKGHEDYIHCVTVRPNTQQQCLSASEDGTVRLWDTRSGGREAVHIIEPQKNEECARPHIGKFVSCVAVDKADDWMVCGGGPSVCLWHLRSMSPTSVFQIPNVAVNVAMFHDDTVITAGNESFVDHWTLNGDKRAHVPTTATNVFSVAINNCSDNKVLSCAGNSHKIDVCINFSYKAFSLTFA